MKDALDACVENPAAVLVRVAKADARQRLGVANAEVAAQLLLERSKVFVEALHVDYVKLLAL